MQEGVETVRKERREQLKWRHPSDIKRQPAGAGESGGIGLGSCGLSQSLPTPSAPLHQNPWGHGHLHAGMGGRGGA